MSSLNSAAFVLVMLGSMLYVYRTLSRDSLVFVVAGKVKCGFSFRVWQTMLALMLSNCLVLFIYYLLPQGKLEWLDHPVHSMLTVLLLAPFFHWVLGFLLRRSILKLRNQLWKPAGKGGADW